MIGNSLKPQKTLLRRKDAFYRKDVTLPFLLKKDSQSCTGIPTTLDSSPLRKLSQRNIKPSLLEGTLEYQRINQTEDTYTQLEENITALSQLYDEPYNESLFENNGICVGLCSMWLQAFLINDLKSFYARMNLLTSQDTDELIEKTQLVIEKSKNRDSLTLNETLYLSIKAFLDELLLHQKPRNTSLYKDSIDRSLNNQLSSIPSKYGMNQRLEQLYKDSNPHQHSQENNIMLGPICKTVFVGDTAENYMQHLLHLISEFEKNNPNQPFCILIFNLDHMVSLGIFGDDLLFYDANFMVDEMEHYHTVYKRAQLKDMVEEQLFPAFSDNKEVLGFQIYSANHLYSEGTEPHELPIELSYIEQIMETPSKEHKKLLDLVCKTNNVKLLKKLLQDYDDFFSDQKMDCLIASCFFGYSNITRALLESMTISEINSRNNYQITPLMAACFQGYQPCIQLLLDHGANTQLLVEGKTAADFYQSEHYGKPEYDHELYMQLTQPSH